MLRSVIRSLFSLERELYRGIVSNITSSRTIITFDIVSSCTDGSEYGADE